MLALFGVAANRVEYDPDLARLSIIGVFQQIDAPAFPYTIDTMGVAARFEISPEEFGKSVTANVALVDESGRRNHVDQRQRGLPAAQTGRPTFWDFALNLSRIQVDAPGHYQIVFRIDKEIVAEVPLWVVGPAAAS